MVFEQISCSLKNVHVKKDLNFLNGNFDIINVRFQRRFVTSLIAPK